MDDISRVLEQRLGIIPGRDCVIGEGMAMVRLGLFVDNRQVGLKAGMQFKVALNWPRNAFVVTVVQLRTSFKRVLGTGARSQKKSLMTYQVLCLVTENRINSPQALKGYLW